MRNKVFAHHRAVFGDPAGFVTKRPDYDRRAIFVPLHHTTLTVQHLFLEYFHVDNAVVLVPIIVTMTGNRTMRFDIGFFQNVNAVFVAKFSKQRIVTCAHGIDIVLFHKQNVAHHIVNGFDISVDRHAVTINAFELSRFSVYAQHVALITYGTHSDIITDILSVAGNNDFVQVGRFCSPQIGI